MTIRTQRSGGRARLPQDQRPFEETDLNRDRSIQTSAASFFSPSAMAENSTTVGTVFAVVNEQAAHTSANMDSLSGVHSL